MGDELLQLGQPSNELIGRHAPKDTPAVLFAI
jgi:hypothetical protein